jgi:hypothetical protein
MMMRGNDVAGDVLSFNWFLLVAFHARTHARNNINQVPQANLGGVGAATSGRPRTFTE